MVQAQVDLNDAIYKWSVDAGQYIIDLQRINAKYDFNKSSRSLPRGRSHLIPSQERSLLGLEWLMTLFI